MRNYYIIRDKNNPNTNVHVICKDTMEMYYFLTLYNKENKYSIALMCCGFLIALCFPVISSGLNLSYRIFALIPASLASLAAFVGAIKLNDSRLSSMLDSYPLERNHFIPTKRYLKPIKNRQLFYFIMLLFCIVFLISVFLFLAFNVGIDVAYSSTNVSLVLSPTLLYVFVFALFTYFSNYLALRRYEKINEDRLRFDGPVVYPDLSPETYLPDSTLPLYACIDDLSFDKSNGGYLIEDVDAFLGELRRDLLDGCDIPADRIRNATFHKASVFKTGYNISDVDAALEYIAKRIGEQNELSWP